MSVEKIILNCLLFICRQGPICDDDNLLVRPQYINRDPRDETDNIDNKEAKELQKVVGRTFL